MMMLTNILLLGLSTISFPTSAHNTLKEEDIISDLPGLTFSPKFSHYSGYIYGSNQNIHLHYWLTEAEKDPSNKPLVLWLNGGPGCSSFAGLLMENGPYLLKPGLVLKANPHSWNKIANILYLESPIGVGFSYTDGHDVVVDDDMTALNNYHALLNFVEKFPEYKNRDFYIAGESYAGVYIPTLAVKLLDEKFLKLRGIFMGNPLLSYKVNRDSVLYFAHYYGMTDENAWSGVLKSCCRDPCDTKCRFSESASRECQKKIGDIEFIFRPGLNPYNVYAPCDGKITGSFLRSYFDISDTSVSKISNSTDGKVLPCLDDELIHDYMNQPKVTAALHVNPALIGHWDVCSFLVNKEYVRNYRDTSALIMELLYAKIPVTIYSGDVDMACNHVGTDWFISGLKLEKVDPLIMWLYEAHDGTKQVGGWRTTYKHRSTPLQFFTVRGSGHMVPTDKPEQGFHLFSGFINCSGKNCIMSNVLWLCIALSLIFT